MKHPYSAQLTRDLNPNVKTSFNFLCVQLISSKGYKMTDALYWYLSSYDMINPIIIEIEVNGAFEKWTIGKQWYICIYVLYNYFKKKKKLCRDVLLKLFTILSFYHFLLNVYQVCQCLVLQEADAPEEEEEEDLVVRCKWS